jgi:hypothetical protein
VFESPFGSCEFTNACYVVLSPLDRTSQDEGVLLSRGRRDDAGQENETARCVTGVLMTLVVGRSVGRSVGRETEQYVVESSVLCSVLMCFLRCSCYCFAPR